MSGRSNQILSFKAGADLSSKMYHAVKHGADDETVVLAGAGEGFGVLMNSPENGKPADVAYGDLHKVKLGTGGATRGASLKVAADSRFIAGAAGESCLVVCMASGVENDVVEAIIIKHSIPA